MIQNCVQKKQKVPRNIDHVRLHLSTTLVVQPLTQEE